MICSLCDESVQNSKRVLTEHCNLVGRPYVMLSVATLLLLQQGMVWETRVAFTMVFLYTRSNTFCTEQAKLC